MVDVARGLAALVAALVAAGAAEEIREVEHDTLRTRTVTRQPRAVSPAVIGRP